MGGGIDATTATVSNSTLSGNSAGSEGGGIFATYGTVSNSTIVLNRSDTGGGFRRFGSGTFTVNNTIVAGNTNSAGTSPNDIDGTLTGGANNLIGTGGAGELSAANNNILDVPDITTVLNTTLANNGGPTQTHALFPDSQAIDAGNNSLIPSATDQRGFPRIADGNSDSTATVDIGSFEAQ
ncbi:MAG: hypothetical protein HC924_18435 [Synechococcaceae cyanobacterium SM2_3_2]|nr:hypothetical protein [Synechococcaceae cyanobacterium SM2_3_2]